MNDGKIQVYTRFNLPVSKFIDSSSQTRDTYELNDKNELVKTGEVNFYEQIQSYRGLYDVKSIVNRYELGDFTALGVPGGSYLNNIGVDTDLRAYTPIETQNKLERAFASLPEDIRANFKSIEDFSESIRQGTLGERLQRSTGQSGTSQPDVEPNSHGGNN